MLNHYSAIKCIEKRIELINKEITLCQQKLSKSSLISDHEFCKTDLKNFTSEKQDLRVSLQFLTR
jgi:hypothetical protein